MGRALSCPLCRKNEITVEEVRFMRDMWATVPTLEIETMLALVCHNCKHVQIIHPIPEPLHTRPVSLN